MQWFRLYTETLNDPKVQSLDGETFKAWINLLCVAGQCNATCSVTDVSFHLRCTKEQATNYIVELVSVGLFHNNNGILTPHNWDKRQYKSDTSNERVKKYREKKRNVTPPLPVTPPEQNRNRTETEQRKNIGDFEKFWIEYGKIGNKQNALKAFNRIKGVDYETIISGLRRYLDYCRAINQEQRFIKHASSWLNARGWEDEYTVYPHSMARKPTSDDNFTAGINAALSELAKQ